MRQRDEQPNEASAEPAGAAVEQPAEPEPEQNAEHLTDTEQEREPSQDFPRVPGRDVGYGGTRDVDPPPNSPRHTPEVPEPPD